MPSGDIDIELSFDGLSGDNKGGLGYSHPHRIINSIPSGNKTDAHSDIATCRESSKSDSGLRTGKGNMSKGQGKGKRVRLIKVHPIRRSYMYIHNPQQAAFYVGRSWSSSERGCTIPKT